ncbi:MAG TPA: hypothetical protein VGI76_02920 [Solirubrobacteraceae bacterium]|jgi:hypothetical protein
MRKARKIWSSKTAVFALLGVLAGGLIFLTSPALAAPEAPTTEAASGVTGTSATLNGTLNPGASGEAGYFFLYGGGGTCEGANTEPSAEQSGQSIPVSAAVTKLEAKTEYTFCMVATHLEGETPESTVGAPLNFTTPGSAPVTEGGGLSNLTPFSVSASTLVDPENEVTSCIFEYGETSAFGSTVPCEPGSLEGSGSQPVSASFTSLTPGTTYHYRVVAINGEGTTEGAEGEFSTLPLEAPIVDGESTSKVTSASAQLEALVNPNYQETTYAFEYATNNAFTGAITVAGAGPLPAEFADQPTSVAIGGLQPRTTYYYRVVAENETGPTEGPIGEFTTLATPIVTTGAAQEVSRTMANVSGTVNPGGVPTLAHVAFISQEGYEAAGGAEAENPYAGEGGRVTPNANVGLDYTAHSTGTIQLRELKPGTTYHFAVVATNSVGTTIGPDATFTTSPPTPPVAVTGEATGVTQTAATLTGTVDTSGLRTSMYFEVGEVPTLGFPELASIVPGSESGTTVSISISFGNYLPPGTTFYYRARASNADGVSYGAVKSFTTASFPAPPTLTSPPLLVLPPAPPAPKTGHTAPKKKPLSNSQKLAKALKACAKKPKSKRASCKRQARKKYKK